ncbi:MULTISPECIES: MlaC/ttg2D family ABC transporter substrate-binding protein [Roseomonadaceae]|uniref:ABC transporter substrate-binding protein n=1 Tax=Falsiroseomonas oleicola TaxID=2801474 RepID=A0ABS6H4L8_9PROT|nr:ABC transporter substrate-binding protein [Roseomonas oleicola]MBU8543619.1 ABC transporter substrate-binding protein [Roseomonas oleicola]
MTVTARRTLILGTLGGSLGLLSPAGGARAQQMEPQRAANFIRTTGQELVAAINADGPVPQRRDRVGAILRQAVDVQGVGRFILGRWWRTANAQQQQEYLRLFEEVLIRNLSSRFGEYQGLTFSLGRSQSRTEEDVLVSTIVERAGSPAFGLDWRVAEVGGQPRVVDVIAEGTSLRLTTRSEYSSVITRNGNNVQALLGAMRQQITQLAAREGT